MKKLLEILKQIPKGKVTTYKQVAEACELHPRVAAQILRNNKEPAEYPCYKVVMSNGSIGGYNKGVERKIELLEKDGIIINNRKIDLDKFGWKG